LDSDREHVTSNTFGNFIEGRSEGQEEERRARCDKSLRQINLNLPHISQNNYKRNIILPTTSLPPVRVAVDKMHKAINDNVMLQDHLLKF